MADSTQLSRLFQNLISNAIKFRSDKNPKVYIGAQPKENEWVFLVRDNGIGIDPKDAERIFVIFQRLHTREQYSGTGMVLPYVSVSLNGTATDSGGIATQQKGSTFCFTIPNTKEF